MSLRLKEVRQRILTTRQIAKVTGALQKVAAARLGRDRRAAESSAVYAAGLAQALADLLAADPEAAHGHPLLAPRAGGQVGLAIFGSDRGLCGGFNATLMEAAERFVAERGAESVRVYPVGKVVQRRVRRLGWTVERAFGQAEPGGAAAVAGPIAAQAVAAFRGGRFGEAWLAYQRFVSPANQVPTLARLLPAALPRGVRPSPGAAAATCEPAPRALLDLLLPEWVGHAAHDAFLHSAASENAARQTAMARATENAQDVLGKLMVAYSRLRQESITTEMIELAGSMAESA
jgi:F-type H+-transporting ATPase subunit gamma